MQVSLEGWTVVEVDIGQLTRQRLRSDGVVDRVFHPGRPHVSAQMGGHWAARDVPLLVETEGEVADPEVGSLVDHDPGMTWRHAQRRVAWDHFVLVLRVRH